MAGLADKLKGEKQTGGRRKGRKTRKSRKNRNNTVKRQYRRGGSDLDESKNKKH